MSAESAVDAEREPNFLLAPWVASGLLVVQWLGDSLDGTLARVREIQRPKYGYYIDHLRRRDLDGGDRDRPRPCRRSCCCRSRR
jgi:hypothetical protein